MPFVNPNDKEAYSMLWNTKIGGIQKLIIHMKSCILAVFLEADVVILVRKLIEFWNVLKYEEVEAKLCINSAYQASVMA